MLQAVLLASSLSGDLGQDVMLIVSAVALLLLLPLLLVVVVAAAVVAPLPVGEAGSTGPPLVPAEQLQVMLEVSARSGVPWELLAATVSVESGPGADPYRYRDAIATIARDLIRRGRGVRHPAGRLRLQPLLAASLAGACPGPVLPGVRTRPTTVVGSGSGGSTVIAGRGAAYALLGLAALLMVLAISSGWSGASRLASRGDEPADDPAGAATAFVRAYGNFDYRGAERYMADLAELTTGALRDALRGAAVDGAALAEQRTSTALVESAVLDAQSDRASVVTVRSRQERSWLDSANGRRAREAVVQLVSCRLVREGGRWLVAELVLIGEETAGASGAQPAEAADAGSGRWRRE